MKDNLILVRMTYLSLAYDQPNLSSRQLYAHVAMATSTGMAHVLLGSVREKVDHCRNW